MHTSRCVFYSSLFSLFLFRSLFSPSSSASPARVRYPAFVILPAVHASPRIHVGASVTLIPRDSLTRLFQVVSRHTDSRWHHCLRMFVSRRDFHRDGIWSLWPMDVEFFCEQCEFLSKENLVWLSKSRDAIKKRFVGKACLSSSNSVCWMFCCSQ